MRMISDKQTKEPIDLEFGKRSTCGHLHLIKNNFHFPAFLHFYFGTK
jgi:hypothetical protein